MSIYKPDRNGRRNLSEIVTALVLNGAPEWKIENARRDVRYFEAQQAIRKLVAGMPWLTDQGRRNLAAIILDQNSDS